MITKLIGLTLFMILHLWLYTPVAVGAEPTVRELSIVEALQLAEKFSPGLRASSARETQAQANVSIAQSYLYPNFYLNAVDATGFAGANSPAPPQFGGLMNSPFRVGPSIGALGTWTLFDLSRWYEVDSSRETQHTREEDTKVQRVQVDHATLSAYFDASRSRGQMEVWQNIGERINSVQKTLERLVRNGQYSKVQLFLIQDQAYDTAVQQAASQERYRQALVRLALLTGLNDKEITCPGPNSLTERQQPSGAQSPLLTRAEQDLKAANAQSSQAQSEYLPKLYAQGSAGYLNDVRLVSQTNYSVWLGLTFPLFEGFRISSETQRANAVVDEKENSLRAAKLQLDDLNARYDEQINLSRVQLKLLEQEHQTALEAFNLTKKRYLAFLEPVANLTEAIRNLARIETQMNDLKANLILSLDSKAVLNGVDLSGSTQ